MIKKLWNFNRELVLAILLALVTLFVFCIILGNGFSDWDDKRMLFTNKQVFDLSYENVKTYFTSFYSGQYSPLNTLCYGIIYRITSIAPINYHAFSISLHVTNVLLVFNLIRVLLERAQVSIAGILMNKGMILSTSFLTALLFAIHPMQVESVAWISASKILLYSTFFLLSMIAYLVFLKSGKIYYYLISIFLFAVSFGAKEQTVVFPCCLIAIDYLLGRNLLASKVIFEKVPYFCLSLLFAYVSIEAQKSGFDKMLINQYYPLSQRALLANFSFIEYINKIFLPVKLSQFYNFPMEVGAVLPLKYWFYPILMIFLFGFIFRSYISRNRLAVFAFLFFLINITLALHIIPLARKALIADRYVYLSSIGVFLFIAAQITVWFSKLDRQRRKYLVAAFVTYILGLAGYTMYYAHHFI
jgi:hypothetical protein